MNTWYKHKRCPEGRMAFTVHPRRNPLLREHKSLILILHWYSSTLTLNAQGKNVFYGHPGVMTSMVKFQEIPQINCGFCFSLTVSLFTQWTLRVRPTGSAQEAGNSSRRETGHFVKWWFPRRGKPSSFHLITCQDLWFRVDFCIPRILPVPRGPPEVEWVGL